MSKEKKYHDFNNQINSSILEKNTKESKNTINLEKKTSTQSKKLSNSQEVIFDAPVDISIELGRKKIKIKELLDFSKGSMLFLDQQKEDFLKIFANGKLVAFGEIVVLENTYGVRIVSVKNS
ncbi:Flagellar motor switch protein FliN [Buchnera aphidicola (Protaphis terricola)]|uniref:FliM/FliN family flagellar motor switch protein n=1 Tax=Buchnera aphidicola TaxID=9 RepID=UPI003463C761